MAKIHCARIRLKPGSLPRVREWASELNKRMDEVLATLEDEEVNRETVFLEHGPEGEHLIYFMDEERDRPHKPLEKSKHAIDAYHRQFKRETWESRQELELLLDAVRTRRPGSPH